MKRKLQTKLQIPILITTVLVFGISIAVIAFRTHQLAVNDAKTIVNATAREYANMIASDLQQEINISRTFAQSILGYLEHNKDQAIDLTKTTLKNVVSRYPEIYATWVSFELSALDPEWKLDYGRKRITVNKNGNNYEIIEDDIDLKGDNVDGIYYQSKIEKKELEGENN